MAVTKTKAELERELRQLKADMNKKKKRFFLVRWLDGRDGEYGNLKSQYFWPALLVAACATAFLCHVRWA